MSRRLVFFTMAVALALPATSTLHAAPLGMFHHTATDKAAAGKLIHFSIRNDSKQPLVFKVGDQQFTIQAGQSLAMKLAEGTSVVAVSGSADLTPGAVLTKVSTNLENNTLAVS